MEKERAMLLNVIKGNKSNLKSAFNIILKPKSAEAAESARKKGNALFLQNKKHDAITHEQIFYSYCESVALAPNESQELALAYGNRSYLLLHMHKYEECIKDIDRALKVSNSDVLKAKLMCRKAECLKRLGSSNISSILETVQNLIDKIDREDRMKLLEMFDAVKALVANKKIKDNDRINDYKIPLTDDYSSRVSIEYNENYGRHLVATRDYKPGDIIFHEKVYASCVDRLNTYCQYCQNPVWSSVPCNNCSWAVFCSEDCREKAWSNFHEIECSLFSHFKLVSPMWWKLLMLHVRILITAIKETGSIANLREKIESVDKCTDVRSKGFFENGKLVTNSIQNIYSLSKDASDPSFLACNVALILISLTKYSKLKDDFDVKQVEDLEMTEDIIFMGSFLIRIISVYSVNAFSYTTEVANIDKLEDPEQWKKVDYVGRRFVSTLSSLFNHSCFSTACWRFTDQSTILIVALQPIKADTQIFISYGNPFYNENQSLRHAFLLKYKLTCECQACVEAWPPILFNLDYFPQKELGNNDMKKNEKMVEENYRHFKEGKIDDKYVKNLSASITKASNFKQPSLTYCLLIDLLRKVLLSMYSPKPPSFDLCD